ncbi:MAG: histidine--tRNA ligase [Candidatus Micrarchaeia archaeon]
MPEIPFPRGVRDLMPNEALFRNELIKKVEEIYQRFGFINIDTPSFERLEVLSAKGGIGDEGNKQIFEIKDENAALRYDHTVSLARYLAVHQSLPMPFKRYYIGKAWRKEEPQKNRYREFTQADVDIVGGEKAVSDAEAIAAIATAFDEIGVEYAVRIGSREVLNSFLNSIGIDAKRHVDIMRVMDKYDKIGIDGVNVELERLGVEKSKIDEISSFMSKEGTNEEKIEFAKDVTKDEKCLEEISDTLQLLPLYKIRGKAVVDFGVVRGIDYYTGIVMEFSTPDMKASICGGGRYDNLIQLYKGKSYPAVGVSMGIDRIMDLLDFKSSERITYAKVFVAYVKENNKQRAIEVAQILRANSINTDLNLAKRNLANQLAYADALKLKYAIIIGDAEEKAGKVRLRNLISGEEELLTIDEAIEELREKN